MSVTAGALAISDDMVTPLPGCVPMLSASDLTLAAVAVHGWQVVLLRERSKMPIGRHWTITRDVDVIRRHLGRGGNIGLVCGPESGVAVLDGDDLDLAREMFGALGPLDVWGETGSGKIHCYVKWEPNLPAKLMWQGRTVGEVQRGGLGPAGRSVLQHVVLPPSIHPGNPRKGIPPGGIYRWLSDPRDPLPTLSQAWRVHLLTRVVPSGASPGRGLDARSATASPSNSIPASNSTGANHKRDTSWGGPPPDALLHRAMQQPGARQRSGGVKFQCPGCRAEGHDSHMDNAVVWLDGRWGCAVNRQHRRAIGEALGVVLEVGLAISGYDQSVLRRLGAFWL